MHNEFIAKVTNHHQLSGLVVWLRGGGVTYELSHDKRLKPVAIHAEKTSTLELAVYEKGFSTSSAGDFLPITEIDPNLFKGVK